MEGEENAMSFTQIMEAHQSQVEANATLNCAPLMKKIEVKGAAIGKLFVKENLIKYHIQLSAINDHQAESMAQYLRSALKAKKVDEYFYREKYECLLTREKTLKEMCPKFVELVKSLKYMNTVTFPQLKERRAAYHLKLQANSKKQKKRKTIVLNKTAKYEAKIQELKDDVDKKNQENQEISKELEELEQELAMIEKELEGETFDLDGFSAKDEELQEKLKLAETSDAEKQMKCQELEIECSAEEQKLGEAAAHAESLKIEKGVISIALDLEETTGAAIVKNLEAADGLEVIFGLHENPLFQEILDSNELDEFNEKYQKLMEYHADIAKDIEREETHQMKVKVQLFELINEVNHAEANYKDKEQQASKQQELKNQKASDLMQATEQKMKFDEIKKLKKANEKLIREQGQQKAKHAMIISEANKEIKKYHDENEKMQSMMDSIESLRSEMASSSGSSVRSFDIRSIRDKTPVRQPIKQPIKIELDDSMSFDAASSPDKVDVLNTSTDSEMQPNYFFFGNQRGRVMSLDREVVEDDASVVEFET